MRLTFWLKSSSELAQFKTVPTWFAFKNLYLVSVEFFPFLICMLWTLHLTKHYIRVCFFGRWFNHHFATLAAPKFDGGKKQAPPRFIELVNATLSQAERTVASEASMRVFLSMLQCWHRKDMGKRSIFSSWTGTSLIDTRGIKSIIEKECVNQNIHILFWNPSHM